MQDKLNKNEYFEHIANTKIALDLIQKDINTRNNIPEFCQLLDQKASNKSGCFVIFFVYTEGP